MSQPLEGRKIGLLTASASRAGGGVFEAVIAQAELIKALGGTACVFALGDADSPRDRQRFGSSEVIHAQVIGPRQIGFAPSLLAALLAASLDCLHLHGIWMYPSRAGQLWARQTGRPYIISPHGMLDPWITARGRWKKALARLGYERAGWARASALHALTPAEAKDIARETGRCDSIVIANAAPPAQAFACKTRPPVVVYLGRIHPKKNLIALIEAWTRVSRPDGARLRIAGWGDPADVAALQQAIAAAEPGIEFLGPVYGDEKAALLTGARFMVLPSLSEGLPMAILEAWSAATPTIMTRQCNLGEGFAAGAALECGYGPAKIAAALEAALMMGDGDWQAMSQAAHHLATTSFSGAEIAASWGAAYSGRLPGLSGKA